MIRVTFMLFIAVQGLLVGLDCYDLRQAGRDGTTDGWPPLRTTVFLFMTGGVFLSLQLLGSWIVPGADELLEGCRLLLTQAFGAQPAGEPTGWTLVWLGTVVFYTAGFWDYFVHRAFSHSRWFWFTHEYHHLPRKVSLIMPGILVRPFAFIPGCLTSLGTGLTLYLLFLVTGLPLWNLRPILPAMLLIVVILTAHHSSFLRRLPRVHRVLRYLLVTTPLEHVLHHAVISQCNYGNFTTAWDRMFQTYRDPIDLNCEQIPLGLAYDQDFLGTLTLGRWKLSPALRHWLQVSRYCNLDEPPDRNRDRLPDVHSVAEVENEERP